MAIVTTFVRASRIDETPGCPLAEPGKPPREASCASCRYNVIAHGEARIGCLMITPAEDYRNAMAHLQKISPQDHDTLIKIIAAERETDQQTGISPEQLHRVLEITKKWWDLVGNDVAERQVVGVAHRFTETAIKLHETIRIFG